MTDMTSRLPDGSYFGFWEVEQEYRRELHVACNHPNASDDNDGSPERPLKTINAAARIATPGTRVWIHGGVYRECVRPAAGGSGPDSMICYEGYGDGDAVIKASIVATEFRKSTGWRLTRFPTQHIDETQFQIWEIKLNPNEFKGYNPFCAVNILHDRLFIEYDKTDMTTYLNRRGMVFCDGKPLLQVQLYYQLAEHPGSYWVEANGQTVHFRLPDDDDPRSHLIELTCREQCFAPEIPFLSYIKVKNLVFEHAATGAPVPQRGAVSCFRGHHWIIEDCTVNWSNGVGIDIGNECWHHTFIDGQVLGYTVIRRCKIIDAGVCGIAGMFAGNILIEDNLIQGTGWQKMELSWEAGGIKVHNCTNSLIRRNIFTKTIRADHLWLDVGNENNRITQNLFLDGIEQREAIFIECSRDGVNLIDNNIFWNIEGRFDPRDIPEEPGSSGWYKMEENSVVNGYAVYGEGTDHLHISNNLIGKCRSAGYFAKVVAFRLTGLSRGGTSRDARLYNNIFYECGEAAIKMPTEKNSADGNLYVCMPSGYLRILYPAPEVCLDLSAWKEFYGFDMNGQEGWFEIEVDTENYTLRIGKGKQVPFRMARAKKEYITEASKVEKVPADSMAPNDFYGTEINEPVRLPGPFIEISVDKVYNIDPRKMK
ncbi:MAG: right-handed parallel beta-helix repeat-containing protein [Bacillota bacterium]